MARFITGQENNYLILLFSFAEDTEFEEDGFIVRRSPKCEFALNSDARGPCIDLTEEDQRILIKEVKLKRPEIKLQT